MSVPVLTAHAQEALPELPMPFEEFIDNECKSETVLSRADYAVALDAEYERGLVEADKLIKEMKLPEEDDKSLRAFVEYFWNKKRFDMLLNYEGAYLKVVWQ